MNKSILKCPICSQPIRLFNKNYQCPNKHSFDLAKAGYVNLLLKQSKKSFGDSKEMIQARQLFFSHNFYKPLKEQLTLLLRKINPPSILDSGCGEGYYTNHLANQLPNSDFYALDISKYAISQATKSKLEINFLVASNQKLPFLDGSLACILNIYSPFDLSEYLRVLNNQGYLILVASGKNHLIELKEVLYDTVKIIEPDLIASTNLILKESIPISFTFTLNNRELINSLFMMTPYYFRTSEKDKKKLEQLSTLTLTADFIIYVYNKS